MFSYAHELVHCRVSAENGPVAYLHLSGQRYVVDQYDIISDHAIVSHVRVCHDEAVVAHYRLAFGRSTAIDGSALAYDCAVTYLRGRVFAFEFEILRYAGHYSTAVNHASLSQTCTLENRGMGPDVRTCPYDGVRRYVSERFDSDVLAYFSVGVNVCQIAYHKCLVF